MVHPSSPQRLRHVLDDSSHLRQLLAHSRHLSHIEHRLRTLWPEPLNPHLCVLNLHEHTLVLQADSAAWATQARCLIPAMLEMLNGEDPSIAPVRAIRIKVAVGAPFPNVAAGSGTSHR
jgi:hypothetical protein